MKVEKVEQQKPNMTVVKVENPKDKAKRICGELKTFYDEIQQLPEQERLEVLGLMRTFDQSNCIFGKLAAQERHLLGKKEPDRF